MPTVILIIYFHCFIYFVLIVCQSVINDKDIGKFVINLPTDFFVFGICTSEVTDKLKLLSRVLLSKIIRVSSPISNKLIST